jgi:hypothetical protein
MRIIHFFVEDAFKQQQITKFIVEAALLQFITSFFMLSLYVWTNIEPLFLLLAPFALFLFYIVIRYALSGIEFAHVLTEADYYYMQRKNRFRTIGTTIVIAILFYVFTRSFVDSLCISVIAGLLLYCLHTISLKKSYQKNQSI